MKLEDETPADGVARNEIFALRGHEALLERLARLEREPLASFLDHVASTVPYYRTRLAERARSVDTVEPMSRATMRDQRAAFLSSAHLAEAEHLIARTNGTLSPSLPVSFDTAAFYDFNYFSLYRIVESRAGLVEALPPGDVGIVQISNDPDQKRYTVRLPLLGGTLMRRLPLGRGEDEDRAVVHYLRDLAVPVLYGKPHSLLEIARLDRELGGPPLRPRALLCAGERLYPTDRARLAAFFGCPTIDAYTSSEGGLIGLGCPDVGGFHLLNDRLHVEVLEDSGVLASGGTGELVFTNLINWAHAFVRYRQSDVVTLAPACSCGFSGPTIACLHARDARSFEVPAVGSVSTRVLEAILDRPDVFQFEVRQQADGILRIWWRAMPDTDRDETARVLARELGRELHDRYEIARVERIVAPGGKLRRFVAGAIPASA